MRYIVNVDKQLLSVHEAACLYDMLDDKLYYLIKRGAIKSKRMGSRFMVYGSSIERFIEETDRICQQQNRSSR
ncbi:hypothetical protein SAMN02910353_01816 [Ruminococcus sp. YRD2003]|uniref:DNA-binding protein n=1 Tax=Ruminococcus sp. YRD2003 TaxID=1452313 RepID=UPI0008B00C3F|nr:hypothetical protein SAMN02910353_01816 [Ruminococcus flavefaciens]